MAFNFNSGQFNRESTPKRLGNWEVPRWAPTRARPLEMRPNPKPICDINGHFLPGAPRGHSRCFGHYTGTWDLPRNITREVAAQLAKEPPDSRFTDWLNPHVQRPKVVARLRTTKIPKSPVPDAKALAKAEQTFSKDQIEKGKNSDEILADSTQHNSNGEKAEKEKIADNCVDLNDTLEINQKKDPVDADGHGPYVPGSITDTDKRHESYDLLVRKAVEEVHGPQENDTDKFWRKVAENAKNNEASDTNGESMKNSKKGNAFKLPSVNVTQNFQFARKMHVGNLEHQPLPDTLGYRNLTKIAEHRDSDINVKPYAIGWKGYGASGPTCCTKMRIHRPKTSEVKKCDTEGADFKQRPKTSVQDLGRNTNKTMTNMDLAICWDFRPNDPKQEPKPPKHIDGSNGSKAPAVFTMVHTPKEEIDELLRSGHTNPIFNQNRLVEDVGHHPVPYFEKDMTKDKRKDSCDVQHCPQHTNKTENKRDSRSSSGSRRHSNSSVSKPKCDGIHGCGTPSENSRRSSCDMSKIRPDKLDPIKEAWHNNYEKQKEKTRNNRDRNSIESYDKTPLAQGKLCQSSPNESEISRSTKDSLVLNNNNTKHKTCISCNGLSKPVLESKPKEDFKLAFKAGNPNSVQSSNGSHDSKNLKIPKMRHPYAKKSYSIPTLAPPFSIWRDADANGYPEHWRLASVYQHAYKPLEQRRKPLISSVYQ